MVGRQAKNGQIPFTMAPRLDIFLVLNKNLQGASMAEGRGVAILVGAGDAIGAAVARRFAEGGYTVCICRRDATKSQELVDELRAAGLDAHAFSVDARQEVEVQKLFADVETNLGSIEVCLFNAGSNVNKPLLETTEKLFFKAWELACYGGFLVGREAARFMLPRGRGTIFFTGATASLRGGLGFAAFSSAKFGLRAVAQEVDRRGIDRCRHRRWHVTSRNARVVLEQSV